MAKRKSKASHKSPAHHENNAKAVLAFLVLLIAFGVLMLFNTYQQDITSSPSFQFFVVLVVILFSLLIGLLFLINPQKK